MSSFHPDVLKPDPARRARVLPVLDAALKAVDPAAAVAGKMHLKDAALIVGGRTYLLQDYERVLVLAFGKAATPMAQAVKGLGLRLDEGLVITKYGHGPDDPATLAPLDVVEAGHPVPDAMGVAAARRAAELARSATADDLVITLISGGGSALLTLPAEGISLTDLQQTTELLLASGASIDEINTIRKHLSQVKGGQLARLAAPATVISLILSDVIGSPLDVIASGPTVPDSSTWADAWNVIERYQLAEKLPATVRERLQAGLAGDLPDTPKPGDPIFQRVQTLVVGDNAIAAEAARQAAEKQGFAATILSTFVQGEAREVARVLVALGREVVVHQRPLAPPACLILGGETTVTLHGQGRGGRNQEMALAAAIELAQTPEADDIVIVALATDGTDGPTDAAGGIADATSVSRGMAAGLDARQHLANNDAYPWLKATNDMLITGPTRTNVNDLYFVFVF
jgi:hydroxypyruvate reductase